MCDKLVYDLAQEVEGSPCVFVRKDWINILDNQNQSYVSNQSVLDTSQLSNSNKWMSYREAYFSIPFTITMASLNKITNANATGISSAAHGGGVAVSYTSTFSPNIPTTSADLSVGLKNWFGNIIHSFTLDYNGSTIIQQTPFVNMWNSFKLMTSLSYQDVITQGATIGFYPDDAESLSYYDTDLVYPSNVVATNFSEAEIPVYGCGTMNNTNLARHETPGRHLNNFKSECGNIGLIERQKWIAFNDLARTGFSTADDQAIIPRGSSYSSLIAQNQLNALWKASIFKQTANVVTNTNTLAGVQSTPGLLQYAVVATVYLKHIHSFFNMIPLLKGVFMKMTMNLNNCACTVVAGIGANFTNAPTAGDTYSPHYKFLTCSEVSSALGGSNMLMVANIEGLNGGRNLIPTASAAVDGPNGVELYPAVPRAGIVAAGVLPGIYSAGLPYRVSLSVGQACLDSTTQSISGMSAILGNNPLSKSIYLYIPAYTFNPTFEQAYLSSPVKTIKYSDVYQYQVANIDTNSPFNNLVTNGIANIKSVLLLPFYSTKSVTTPQPDPYRVNITHSPNTGFTQGLPVWQSPFDPAGCGATSPLCHITNFNIQVSGQNAIYNLQKYNFEQFNNQLYGQNAVNGGLTDGITSSLINRQNFDLEYCYYYVNVERMLPVEQSVPKSIQILGTNMSAKAIDLIVFVEYGTEIQIDALTGARV